MTDLQKQLTSMFSWFHEFCIQNGLRYYALGGTALGAVRHNGFIPWDDDIDVGMPREDYERLKAMSSSINGKTPYAVEFPSDRKDFVYPYGKLYDINTTLVENTRYKTKRGIFIDIFPLDGIGDDKDEVLKRFRKMDRLVSLLYTRTCAIRRERKWYKNLAIILSRCVPDIILNHCKLAKKIDTMASYIPFDTSKYVINSFGAWREKEIHERSIYGVPTLCKFENLEIYVQEDVDAYLTGVYGDYMKLPPIEKQVTHHDYVRMDLNVGYMDDC